MKSSASKVLGKMALSNSMGVSTDTATFDRVTWKYISMFFFSSYVTWRKACANAQEACMHNEVSSIDPGVRVLWFKSQLSQLLVIGLWVRLP